MNGSQLKATLQGVKIRTQNFPNHEIMVTKLLCQNKLEMVKLLFIKMTLPTI